MQAEAVWRAGGAAMWDGEYSALVDDMNEGEGYFMSLNPAKWVPHLVMCYLSVQSGVFIVHK